MAGSPPVEQPPAGSAPIEPARSRPTSPALVPDAARWARIRSLPTAELHLHIEGTLEPELVFELAARNNVRLPFDSLDALRSSYEFADLQSFLDLYYECMAVLRTRDDFRALGERYLYRAHEQGVRHVEAFFDAQAHVARGVSAETVLDGLLDAFRAGERLGITGGPILSFLRDRPVSEAMDTLESLAHRADSLLGVGLDSAEVGYPPELFVPVFARAKELGLHRVAHAGEEGPPSYVRDALDLLGAERIDHGVRALEDPDLMDRLRRDRVPLTVCPFSNVKLAVVVDLGRHPIMELLADGLLVTVNSDDPAYFGGYLADNMAGLASAFGLPEEVLGQLARNSVEASFAGDERKRELFALIDEWSRGGPDGPPRP